MAERPLEQLPVPALQLPLLEGEILVGIRRGICLFVLLIYSDNPRDQ